MANKGDRHHEGQDLAGAALGEPFLNRGKENAAGGYRPPKHHQSDRGQRGARSKLLRHVEGRPIAVHRLADAVEKCKRRKGPEPRREYRAPAAGAGGTALRSLLEGAEAG